MMGRFLKRLAPACAGALLWTPAASAWGHEDGLLPVVAAEPQILDRPLGEPQQDTRRPCIALIIDDLGNQHLADERAIHLPGAVTYAFLPHTPHAARLANLAHARDREVILHLPMESAPDLPLGPGGLTLDMDEQQVLASLEAALASVPHVKGINNHMGSLLTRHPGHMDWVMRRLAQHELFFVDSRTTPKTIAYRIAQERRVPFTQRDVFLDAQQDDTDYVRRQFEALIARARHKGMALGIGHPHPETLAVLEEVLPRLRDEGIELVPISQYIAESERRQTWQASLSPLPRAAKN